MKKLIALILMVVLCVGFTACGKPAGGGNNNNAEINFKVPEVGYDGSEVNLTFYHTMGENLRTVLDAYIVEFNKLFPNIHIEHKQVGGYDDVRSQVSTELQVGNSPNIAYCYPDHVALYNVSGAVAHLDNLIASDIEVLRNDGTTETLGLTQAQKDDFIQGYYTEGQQFGDGLMYTMPFSKSTEVLYYNKTFFDQHGLQLPKTWAEMKTLCERILEIDPTCIPLGYDSEANWFITMCEQYGSPYTSAEEGDHFLFDNAKNKEFVKEFRQWYKAGLVTTQEIYGAYTSGLFVEQGVNEDGTPKQRSYMSIGSSAGATHQRPTKNANGEYPFEVGITSIPQVNPAKPKVISQGPSVCIFKKDNAQEVVASWLFVKYLTTTTAFQAEFSSVSGYVPVIKSVAQNEAYAANLAKANGGDYIAYLSAKVCLEQQDAYYTSPAFNGSSIAREQVQQLLIACLTTDAQDVDAEINRLFQLAIDECEYNV